MINVMKKSVDRRNIIRDTSFFSGGTYIAQTMFFIRGFLNATILGPTLYGLWAALNIILKYANYVHLGSQNAMSREVPYHNGRSSKEGMDKARNVGFTICLVTNLIFSSILIVIALFLWKRLAFNEALGLITIALLAFITSIYVFYQASLIAVKRFLLISKARVIFAILSVILTLILVPHFKIYGVYIIALAISLSGLIYLWLREPYRLSLNFDMREISKLIKIGFPIMSINFLEGTMVSIGGIAVMTLLGKTNMGYYAVAMLAGNFLMYFPDSIRIAFEPHIYQRYGETHEILELKKYLFKPTVVMSLLFPIILAFYYTACTFFIRHFLPKYIVSIYPLLIILIARFFLSFSPTAIAIITAINKQRFLIPVYLGSIIIVSISSLLFIKMGFGITAVAIGLLLSFLFTGTVIFIYALGHYLKNMLKCLLYLISLYLPLLYIVAIVLFNEVVISSSVDLFSDTQKLIIKLGVLSIFSLPLIYIADKKTGVILEILRFLSLERFRSKGRLEATT